jgi:MauM/NapG family ferredoxin protein
MSRRTARRLRRLVQVGFLALFLVLGFVTFQDRAAGELAEGLFPFDPLAALTSMLATRSWIGGMMWAIGTVVLTVVLGRFWCGWICPLGTVLEYVRFKGARRKELRISPRWRAVKYVILTVLVIMAALGSLTLLVLDPITVFNRTVATAVVPAVDAAVRGVQNAVADVGWLAGAVEWVDNTLRGSVLPTVAPFFAQGIAMAVFFLSIVALNLLADRFWCRYLCPLGALLGAFAKLAVLRPIVGDACADCSSCVSSCRLGAIEVEAVSSETGEELGDAAGTPSTAVVTSECTVCLDCLVTCEKRAAMRFGRAPRPGPWRNYDPARRELLAGTAVGAGAVALLGIGPWHRDTSPHLLRPPGVADENEFLSACIRCGACFNVCPTSGLQPALAQAGASGLWTPVLQPRLGFCDYSCNACGQVCPTGAIPPLRLGSKRRAVVGIAVIDRNTCLPWAQNTTCAVCWELCPVPKRAIKLGKGRTVIGPSGGELWIRNPTVVPERCIGCGICENRCPVQGTSAITVQPVSSAPAPPADPYGLAD